MVRVRPHLVAAAVTGILAGLAACGAAQPDPASAPQSDADGGAGKESKERQPVTRDPGARNHCS